MSVNAANNTMFNESDVLGEKMFTVQLFLTVPLDEMFSRQLNI